MYNIEECLMFRTVDGRMFDDYDEAVKHIIAKEDNPFKKAIKKGWIFYDKNFKKIDILKVLKEDRLKDVFGIYVPNWNNKLWNDIAYFLKDTDLDDDFTYDIITDDLQEGESAFFYYYFDYSSWHNLIKIRRDIKSFLDKAILEG